MPLILHLCTVTKKCLNLRRNLSCGCPAFDYIYSIYLYCIWPRNPTYTVASAPTVTDSVLMRRIRLFLGLCACYTNPLCFCLFMYLVTNLPLLCRAASAQRAAALPRDCEDVPAAAGGCQDIQDPPPASVLSTPQDRGSHRCVGTRPAHSAQYCFTE